MTVAVTRWGFTRFDSGHRATGPYRAGYQRKGNIMTEYTGAVTLYVTLPVDSADRDAAVTDWLDSVSGGRAPLCWQATGWDWQDGSEELAVTLLCDTFEAATLAEAYTAITETVDAVAVCDSHDRFTGFWDLSWQ